MKLPNWMKGSLEPDLNLPGYLRRWWVIPKNKWFNVYLHCFEGSDLDRALHNHPWRSCSFLLKGKLTENYKPYLFDMTVQHRRIRKFTPYFRDQKMFHSMYLESDKAWTLFLTGGRTNRWGFEYPEHGDFTYWKDFFEEHPDVRGSS